jgi:glycosyltransferase involved in cell wall biosynthesis
MRRKKICMITTFHRPNDSRIYHKEAGSLQIHYDVVIVAPDETEPRSKDITTDYDDAGIKIVKIPKPKGLLRSLTMFRRQILRTAVRENCDVYHCHELDSLLISILIKMLYRKKVIYDVHEHWPSALAHMAGSLKHLSFLQRKSASRIIQTLVARIERILAKRADAIIAVSESVGDRFRDINVPTAVIPNVPIRMFNRKPGPESLPHNLVYMGGSLGYVHGIDLCGDLLSSLSARYSDISMTFVGKLDDRALHLSFFKEHADRIAVTGLLPIDRMYQEIAQGQVGLLLFRNTHHNMYIGLPNKLFDYMQCGIPVVASAFPEIRRVVETAGCGICVDPENVEAVAAAVRYLLDNPTEAERMGKNGKALVDARYNWDTVEQDLRRIYSTVI